MRIDPTYGVLTRVALDAEPPQLRRSRFYAIYAIYAIFSTHLRLSLWMGVSFMETN